MTAPASDAASVLPPSWRAVDGLVAGFGDRRLAPPSSTILLRTQVHGAKVVDVAGRRDDTEPDAQGYARLRDDADALVAREAGLVVGVRTADCVPVLLVAPERRWAAAVHAGWRGTIAGIVTEALRAASEAGVAASEVQAALGPSIGPCCYEVSPELAARFSDAGLPALAPGGGRPRPHLDLRAANRVLLERAGLSPAAIHSIGPCTRCAHQTFHSHRADPAGEGRQVSWIGWADRTR